MRFYIGTYTEGFFGEGPNGSEGIYLAEIGTDGKITFLDSFPDSVNPSFLRLSPDGRYLAVADEKLPPSRMDLYAVSEEGSLSLLDTFVYGGRSCCYVDFAGDGSFVAAANYGSGEVFTVPVNAGRFAEISSSYRSAHTGPNADRQDLPHAHSVRRMGNENFVSCDLGCDTVCFYTRQRGKLVPSALGQIRVPAGCGPRHTENSEDGRFLYITCELTSELLVYERREGKWILLQRLPATSGNGEGNLTADIHFSPDRSVLYVSNRGEDDIAEFRVLEDGRVEPLAFLMTGGKSPRNFAVTDGFIICANQDSDSVTVLERKEGRLTGRILDKVRIISPVCIESRGAK